MRSTLLALVGLALAASPAAAGVITISEVLYDASGADDGKTFIELFGVPGSSLAGYVLEGVNGSNGAVTHHLDLSSFFVPGNGFFVLADGISTGGTLVPGADGVLANVDLQNGPDSLRLLKDGLVVDALGYGAFGPSHLFAGEGEAAPDAAAGTSLARIFANLDTDVNSADFAVLGVPTPGEGPVLAPPSTEVPEPGTWALVGMAVVLLGLRARRHSRKQRTPPSSVTT